MLSRHKRIARKVSMADTMSRKWWPLNTLELNHLLEYGDYIAKPETFHRNNPFLAVPLLLMGKDWLNGYARGNDEILALPIGTDDWLYYQEQKSTWIDYALKQYREGSRLYSFASAPEDYINYLTPITESWVSDSLFMFIPNWAFIDTLLTKLKDMGFEYADDPSFKTRNMLDVMDERLRKMEETAGGVAAFFCVKAPNGFETAFEILDGSTLRNTNMALYHAYLTIEPFIKNLALYNLGTFQPVLTVPTVLRRSMKRGSFATIHLIPKGRVQEFLADRADASGMPLSIMDAYNVHFLKGQFKS